MATGLEQEIMKVMNINVRHLVAAGLMAMGLAAGTLSATPAQAMPRPDPAALSHALQRPLVAEQVRLVCRRVWNGRYWSRQCYHVAPRFVRPHYRYHRPYRSHRYHGPPRRFR